MDNWQNQLYHGNNLEILQHHIPSESVDLVYLDPPFNSNATYNVLFEEQDGTRAAAQIKAFDDTWRWDEAAVRAYEEVVESGGDISKALQAFRTLLGDSNMLAYLSMMTPRLIELRRVLKPTGSIYLHCDPTASHYLKVLMDATFGADRFRNEIVWKRSHPKGLAFTRFASTHDVILAYSASSQNSTWNAVYVSNPRADEQYRLTDQNGRRYQLTSLLNPNSNRPNLTYEFKGVTRVWRWTKERMEQADRQGLIIVPRNGKGIPRLKRYLDEQEGIPVGDFWDDVPIALGRERLGYPTQKPVALLERIIRASSNEGDVILDPFCGCGTAIAAAQKLGRRWIGIDITHLAITLIKHRLKDAFGDAVKYEEISKPVSVRDARILAIKDPYQFQYWALGLVNARPSEQKKGADRGIDGRIYFHDDASGMAKSIILSVKSGHIGNAVRDLRGVIEREEAAIGALITLQDPTRAMRVEAASAGSYSSDGWGKFPRLQILTIEQLLSGKTIERPPTRAEATFKKAPRTQRQPEQGVLMLEKTVLVSEKPRRKPTRSRR